MEHMFCKLPVNHHLHSDEQLISLFYLIIVHIATFFIFLLKSFFINLLLPITGLFYYYWTVLFNQNYFLYIPLVTLTNNILIFF